MKALVDLQEGEVLGQVSDVTNPRKQIGGKWGRWFREGRVRLYDVPEGDGRLVYNTESDSLELSPYPADPNQEHRDTLRVFVDKPNPTPEDRTDAIKAIVALLGVK